MDTVVNGDPSRCEVTEAHTASRGRERIERVAGYSGTPLARKLGITSGGRLLVDGAPSGFAIPDLPEGVESYSAPYDVILSFCPHLHQLMSRWPVLHPLTTPAGALWIAWPKRSSGMQTDLSENVVREFALSHGRVDVKVCAIDDHWAGLKHVIRKTDR